MKFSTISELAAAVAIGIFVSVAVLSISQPEAPQPKVSSGLPDAPPLVAPVAPGNTPPMGYQPHPAESKAFLQSLPNPTIREAGPDLFKDSNIRKLLHDPPKGTAFQPQPAKADDGVYPYRALYKSYRQVYGTDWKCGTQGIGDCVSWGWHHGIAIASAVEHQAGNLAEWKLPATEAIYGGARVEASGHPGDGSRAYGGWSDGSYGAAAAKWVHDRGGILFREKYEPFDLSVYSADRAKQWGAYGCGGKSDGGKADDLAKKHPAKRVALVRTFDEAAAALRSGYPIPVCSMQGFASTRDKDGFARASGSWAHCMCFIAVRFDRPGLLCLNSWGETWVTGPKYPEDMPEGSFWVDVGTVNRMLAQEDSYAVSAVDGFPFRPLDNAGWVSLPNHEQHRNPASLAMAP